MRTLVLLPWLVWLAACAPAAAPRESIPVAPAGRAGPAASTPQRADEEAVLVLARRSAAPVVDLGEVAPPGRGAASIPWRAFSDAAPREPFPRVLVGRHTSDAVAHFGEATRAAAVVRPRGDGRVEHAVVAPEGVPLDFLRDAPRLGLWPMDPFVTVTAWSGDGGAAGGHEVRVVGYLVREADGALAVRAPSPALGATRVALAGTVARGLSSRLDGATFAEVPREDAPARRATLFEAVGHRRWVRTTASPVVVGLRGRARLVEVDVRGSDVERRNELEVTAVEQVVDLRGWQAARARYAGELVEAARALDRDDRARCLAALAKAREVIASTFGDASEPLEVFRWIDRLHAVADGAAGATRPTRALAELALSLGEPRALAERTVALDEERRVATALEHHVFREARRDLERADRDPELARVVVRLAAKEPGQGTALVDAIRRAYGGELP